MAARAGYHLELEGEEVRVLSPRQVEAEDGRPAPCGQQHGAAQHAFQKLSAGQQRQVERVRVHHGGAAEWDILSFVSEPDTDDEEVAGGLGTAAESGGEGEGPSEVVAGPAERRVSVEGGVARRTRAHVSLQHYDIEQLEKFLTVRVARGAGCARRH